MLDLGWGRFYVGGGIGAARVRTEVEFEHTPTSVVNATWKASPSFEAGIAFTGFSQRVIPHIAYRFRWVGDVDSGTFPDGSKVRYKDFNIHDIMFGFTIPLAVDGGSFAPMPSRRDAPVAHDRGGRRGLLDRIPCRRLRRLGYGHRFRRVRARHDAGGVPYNAANTYGLDSDGLFGGGEIGVDWQWGWLVLGLSGEVGYLGLDGSATDPASPGGDTSTTFSSDWYGGMSVRGGLAYERFLAFGRVGVMYVNAEAKTTIPAPRRRVDRRRPRQASRTSSSAGSSGRARNMRSTIVGASAPNTASSI